MPNTTEDMIKQMYESQLATQKEQLTNDYNAANSDLDAQKQQNQKAADANLKRTTVDSQKSAVNNAEYYQAAGLTSGAKAQARLAQDNQLQSDLTAIRTAQQEADAETERQRSLLSQQYAAAIRQAQAENDMQKANALYEEAKQKDAELKQQQKEAASLLGAAGDFSLYGTTYGMTDDQVAALKAEYDRQAAEKATAEEQARLESAAKLMAQGGDFSRYKALYGLTDAEIARLSALYAAENGGVVAGVTGSTGGTGTGGTGSAGGTGGTGGSGGGTAPMFQSSSDYNNGNLTKDQIKEMQTYFGVTADGMWGNQSTKAAGNRTAKDAWDYYQQLKKEPVLREDMQSILNLGYGPISAARLEELIASGEVEEYVEGGMYKYRKVQQKPTNSGSANTRYAAGGLKSALDRDLLTW